MIQVISGLLLRAFVVLSGTALLTFALLWNAPGDPAQTIAMARFDALLSDDVIEQVRQEVGLDKSFWQAFWAWLGPLLRLDLGYSAVTGRPVGPDLWAAVSYSFPLAGAALAIGLAMSVPLAVIATKRPGSLLDRFAVGIASLGNAIPAYWLGLILILLFAVKLAWLPALGASTPAHAILPALTLGLGVAASLTRIIRSGILEARGQAFLLEGIVLVEVIFGRPGLGTFLVQAILSRDFSHVQAVVVLTALIFVTVNLVIDLIYRAIDPRIGENNA